MALTVYGTRFAEKIKIDQLTDTGSDTLYGLGGNDTIIANGYYNVIYGGDGDDSLGGQQAVLPADAVAPGFLRQSTIDGGAGNDSIADYGGDNTNLLMGGLGNDTIAAEGTQDTLDGGAGSDLIMSLNGDNRLVGGAGNDTIGGLIRNSIDAGAGNDVIYLNNGAETVDGGLGNDLISFYWDWLPAGFVSNSVLHGGAGNDTINGPAGDQNALYGDAGADLLYAEAFGSNTLDGGTGRDTLVGVAGGSAEFLLHPTALDSDTLRAWELGNNHIAVSATEFGGGLTAGMSLADNFVLGSAATQAVASFIYSAATGRLYFDSDGTGATAKVMIATIFLSDGVGHPVLAASDFHVIA